MFAAVVQRLQRRALASRRWRGRPRVLIADDDSDLLDALASVAVDGGFEPICAADGLTALELCRKCVERPSLALLDWNMPGLDGLTLATRLREETARELPVFLMSGFDDAFQPRQQPATIQLLRKPFALEHVARIIRATDVVTG
jgi:DNA-binding response OmpR family regulator